MKTVLTMLLIAVMVAEGVLMYRMRKLINSWEKEVEDHDVALTDGEQRQVERWGKLMEDYFAENRIDRASASADLVRLCLAFYSFQ